MKMLTFFHENNEISVHNNLFGKETVKYNGKEMTSQFSLFGSTHDFSVWEDEKEVNYQIKISMSMTVGVSFSLWRNGEALLLGPGCHKKKATASHSDFV